MSHSAALVAVTGCSVQGNVNRITPCQQRGAGTSTCGYTPVITCCPLFIYTVTHLRAAVWPSQPFICLHSLTFCSCVPVCIYFTLWPKDSTFIHAEEAPERYGGEHDVG